MKRFCVSEARVGSTVALPAAESRHADRVLRMRPGDRVALFDGRGGEWLGEIEGTDGGVSVRVLESRSGTSAMDVVVASACPKGRRLEFLVQKLAELGVRAFVPVRFRRSVVRMTPARRTRLERIATEASKQCGRADILEIRDEVDPAALFPSLAPAAVFLASPESEEPLVRAAHRSAAAIIGPEGGLTPEETRLLLDAGARPVTLASTILRIETAAIVSAALLVQPSEHA